MSGNLTARECQEGKLGPQGCGTSRLGLGGPDSCVTGILAGCPMALCFLGVVWSHCCHMDQPLRTSLLTGLCMAEWLTAWDPAPHPFPPPLRPAALHHGLPSVWKRWCAQGGSSVLEGPWAPFQQLAVHTVVPALGSAAWRTQLTFESRSLVLRVHCPVCSSGTWPCTCQGQRHRERQGVQGGGEEAESGPCWSGGEAERPRRSWGPLLTVPLLHSFAGRWPCPGPAPRSALVTCQGDGLPWYPCTLVRGGAC